MILVLKLLVRFFSVNISRIISALFIWSLIIITNLFSERALIRFKAKAKSKLLLLAARLRFYSLPSERMISQDTGGDQVNGAMWRICQLFSGRSYLELKLVLFPKRLLTPPESEKGTRGDHLSYPPSKKGFFPAGDFLENLPKGLRRNNSLAFKLKC